MRVLILGGNGMLGHKLVQSFGREFDTFTTVRRDLAAVERFGIFDAERTFPNIDVTSEDQLRSVLDRVKPDVVVNCVGIIKQVASSPERMIQINTLLPRKLADLSEIFGFRLIAVSTDCVFSGSGGFYSEQDEPDAVDTYGQTKARGEVMRKNCLTIRTSIIGRELDTAHSLVEWFLSRRDSSVKGFTRTIYSGFPTIILAEILATLIRDEPDLSGLYHVSSDPISKFDLLGLVNRAYSANIQIEADGTMVSDRSLDSGKFRAATGFSAPPWPEMIERMAADATPYEQFHTDAAE